MILALLACVSEPTTPPGPHPEATAAAAVNLCKLYQQLQLPCTREGSRVEADGKTIVVTATLEHLDERLGVATLRGRVDLRVDGHTWTTRMSGYGSGLTEAVDRGLHEWALLDGLAFVDALRGDAAHAALRSIETTAADEGLVANQRPVYRGWTLQRPPLEKGLDHADLVLRAAPLVAKLDDGPHALRIEVARNLGKLEFVCYVDGQPAPDLCEAARGARWPEVGGYELRQTYVVAPR